MLPVAPARKSRRTLAYALSGLALTALVGWRLSGESSWVAGNSVPSRSLKHRLSASSFDLGALSVFSGCPSYCPSDPFLLPGMIHWSPEGLANETYWQPFATADDEADHYPDNIRIVNLPHADVLYESALKLAPAQYTAKLEQGQGDGPEWEFLRDKYILLIDERNNLDQLCKVLGGVSSGWGGHLGSACEVPRLGLKIMSWFLFGMVDTEETGWPLHEERPATWERRVPEKMMGFVEEFGLAGRAPDLVLIGSLFWDERFIREFKVEGPGKRQRGQANGFLYSEIAWYRARLRELIKHLRSTYGHDLPVLLRTRQHRLRTANFQALYIYQLDQSLRRAALDVGARLFLWGDLLEGYVKYYDEDMHYALGPNTYLFGDMLFYYLKRGQMRGCWTCPD